MHRNFKQKQEQEEEEEEEVELNTLTNSVILFLRITNEFSIGW